MSTFLAASLLIMRSTRLIVIVPVVLVREKEREGEREREIFVLISMLIAHTLDLNYTEQFTNIIMRRSSRLNACAERSERERLFLDKVRSRCREGLEVRDMGSKGRGAVAQKTFKEGEIVSTYDRETILQKMAHQR